MHLLYTLKTLPYPFHARMVWTFNKLYCFFFMPNPYHLHFKYVNLCKKETKVSQKKFVFSKQNRKYKLLNFLVTIPGCVDKHSGTTEPNLALDNARRTFSPST